MLPDLHEIYFVSFQLHLEALLQIDQLNNSCYISNCGRTIKYEIHPSTKGY